VHVAIDGRSIGSSLGGDETMLRGLLNGLAACAAPGDRFDVLLPRDADVPESIRADDHFAVRRISRVPGPRHFSVDLPRHLTRMARHPDAVFSVTHGPLWGGIPSALMVNDISPLRGNGWYPLRTRVRLRAAFARQVPRAAAVLTVSEFCKEEILSEFSIGPERVFVVPNTVEKPLPLSERDQEDGARWLRRGGVDRPFLLYLGNLHPRKNVVRLMQAFQQASRRSAEVAACQLVVAGGRWWGRGEEEQMRQLSPGSVVMLGHVDDVQREILLTTCRALAYVSLYEGFGLPPVEAMARGVPVVASDTTAIPEVTGGAAWLVDPIDVDAVADGITRVLLDEVLRADLRMRGVRRAGELSVEATGRRAVAALTAASLARA
jgi:glycosyltransferase involved in cell wall biosynthesis